jgi:hypothetical protein
MSLVLTLKLARTKDSGGSSQLNFLPSSGEWLERGSKAGMIKKKSCVRAVPCPLSLRMGGERETDSKFV